MRTGLRYLTIDMHAETRGACRRHGLCSAWCRYRLDAAEVPCALEVADDGPHTLQQVARRLGVTREWIRQIEAKALDRFSKRATLMGIDVSALTFERPEGAPVPDAPAERLGGLRRRLEVIAAEQAKQAEGACK